MHRSTSINRSTCGTEWRDVERCYSVTARYIEECTRVDRHILFFIVSFNINYVYFYVKMEVIVSEQTVYTPVIYCLNVYLEIYDKFRKNATM